MHECNAHKACLTGAIKKAEKICHEKGLRFTDLRKKVFEIICSSHKPAKAYDILAKLKDNDISKPPTVYRSIDFLIEHGLIHKLNSINSYVYCAHPCAHNECYFLICKTCHEAKECCNDVLAKEVQKTSSNHKFSLEKVTLEIEGTCQECTKKIS